MLVRLKRTPVNLLLLLTIMSAIGCATVWEMLHRPNDMIAQGRCDKVEQCRELLRDIQKKLTGLSDPVTLWHYDDRVVYEAILGRQSEALADFERMIELNYADFIGPYTRAKREFAIEHWEAAQTYAEGWELYTSKKVNAEAAEKFRLVLAKGFTSAGVYLGLGLALCEGKDCRKNVPYLNDGVRLAPQSFRLRSTRASALLDLKEVEKAASDIEAIVRQIPPSREAYAARALVLSKSSRFTQAVSDYSKALELELVLPDVYAERAQAFMGLKQFDRSVQDLDKAIEMDSSDASLFSLRGMSQFAQNNQMRAFADWSQALGLAPAQYGAPLVALYTDLLRNSPNDKEILYRRGEALVNVSRYNDAMRDVNGTLNQDPKHAGAYFVRGMAQWGLNQRGQAQSDFSQALLLDPHNNGPAHYQLGLLYSQLFKESKPKNWGHLTNADDHLDRANLTSGQRNYLKALAHGSVDTAGEIAKAIRFCDMAMRAEPNNLSYKALMTQLQDADTQLRNQAIDRVFGIFVGLWAIGAASGAGTTMPATPSKPFSLGSVIKKVDCINSVPAAVAGLCL